MDVLTQEIVESYWLQTSTISIIAPSKIGQERFPFYPQKKCIVYRAAYDIGSNATKTMAAKVNICDTTLEEVYSDKSYPVFFRQDLFRSTIGEFSEDIKSKGLQILQFAKSNIENHYEKGIIHNDDIEHCAIATAAFRKANNGGSYAQELSVKLDIPIRIISQEEEGKLAYYSAVSQLDGKENLPIVWDIGGGKYAAYL